MNLPKTLGMNTATSAPVIAANEPAPEGRLPTGANPIDLKVILDWVTEGRDSPVIVMSPLLVDAICEQFPELRVEDKAYFLGRTWTWEPPDGQEGPYGSGVLYGVVQGAKFFRPTNEPA